MNPFNWISTQAIFANEDIDEISKIKRFNVITKFISEYFQIFFEKNNDEFKYDDNFFTYSISKDIGKSK